MIPGAVLLLMLSAPVTGCVVPPPLQVEADAGAAQDSPPAIITVTGDQTALAEPGPVVLEQGSTMSTLVIKLLDTDLNDKLFVRLYVDYNAPDKLPSRVRCQADPTGTAMRTANCNLSGLCVTADIGVQRNLSIVVSDREPVDSGMNPQDLMMPGLSTGRFYFLRCQPPQTP